MEEQPDKEMALFYQVCQVNELNAEEIESIAGSSYAVEGNRIRKAEMLIHTALEQRAESLLHEAGLKTGDAANFYKIDADPTAPAFVVQEDIIRKHYDAPEAAKVIDALSKVQLPIQA